MNPNIGANFEIMLNTFKRFSNSNASTLPVISGVVWRLKAVKRMRAAGPTKTRSISVVATFTCTLRPLSSRTIDRDWRFARAFLQRALSP